MITIESDGQFEDAYSRLLRDRIVFINGEIHTDMANEVVAQLLILDSIDKNEDIKMYINSSGGEVTAGMAIYDTMQFVNPKIHTICIGQAASMGAVLLAGGAKGYRKALPNAEIMIHQPLGGTGGQTTDIIIYANLIKKTREKIIRILSKHTKQDINKVSLDMERDHWLDADQAKEYGIIDKVIGGSK